MDRRVFIRILLIAVVALTYWQSTKHGFVDFDDPEYARDNLKVQAGLSWDSVQWAFTTGFAGNWHPLTWLSLMLDAELYPGGARNPGGFHMTNMVLHAINVALLFELLLLMTGAMWPSAFVAALLALHPMHVESVAWIAERKDVLSMFFWLATMWAYVRYARTRDWRWYAGTFVLLVLGLMSKPMLVTLPFALLLIDYWPLGRFGDSPRSLQQPPAEPATNGMGAGRPFWKLLVEKSPMIALALLSAYITYEVQLGAKTWQDGVPIPMDVRIGNAIVAYVLYLGKLFWPVDLAVLYPNPSHIGRVSWEMWQIGASAVGLVVITVLACVLSRKRPYLIVGWLWYLGTMVPVIGIVQVGRQLYADRYAYIPFIGLYIIVAWGVADVTSRWKTRQVPLTVAATIVLAACTALTLRQITYWKDSATLFEHTLAVTQDNWISHNNLAAVLERVERRDEAIAHLDAALAIYPKCAWMHNHRGEVLSRNNQPYEAQQAFEESVRLDPNVAAPQFNLGVMLTKRGRAVDGIPHFRRAIELNAKFPGAHGALAAAIDSAEGTDQAIAFVQESLRNDPSLAGELNDVLAVLQTQRSREQP